jgi:hypothetical protein
VPDIDRIALAEVRLLREAQLGNPAALQGLLDPYVSGLWSIVRGHLGRDAAAIEAMVGFRDHLRTSLRRFATDEPFGVQLYGLLWRYLTADLEPSRALGIKPKYPAPGRILRPRGAGDRHLVQEALAMATPVSRLIYLFWLVTDLDAGRMGNLVGLPEQTVRDARATLTAQIQEALSQ